MKLCGKMVEAGQAYNTANQQFLIGLAELSMYHEKHSVITVWSHIMLMLNINVTVSSSALCFTAEMMLMLTVSSSALCFTAEMMLMLTVSSSALCFTSDILDVRH